MIVRVTESTTGGTKSGKHRASGYNNNKWNGLVLYIYTHLYMYDNTTESIS